ncbi:MAG: hypothetical protein ACI9VN_002289 [Patescibacteria group bacterium]|jgi:hypothetical protein
MKTRTTIILLLVAPLFLMSQVNSSIDLVVGIEFSYRTFKVSNDDGITNIFLERKARETQKMNWRIGFNYNRELAKKFYLKSGLRLASVGYKGAKVTNVIATQPVSPGPAQTPPRELQIIYNDWFVELPIIGRLEFSDKKITPFLEFGISPNIYLASRNKIIIDTYTTVEFRPNKDPRFNKLHLVGSLSFGCNYRVGEKYQLFGQPTFRYHLTKGSDGSINEQLMNTCITME